MSVKDSTNFALHAALGSSEAVADLLANNDNAQLIAAIQALCDKLDNDPDLGAEDFLETFNEELE